MERPATSRSRFLRKGLLVTLAMLAAGVLAVVVWFGRYRFMVLVAVGYVPEMGPFPVEGYTDRVFYTAGDTVRFCLRSTHPENRLFVIAHASRDTVARFSFGAIEQALTPEQSEFGAGWTPTLHFPIDDRLAPGLYTAAVQSAGGLDPFHLYFLVDDDSRRPAVISLAPVGTWTAYNSWGGKSLYRNSVEERTVYHASTFRPNSAFMADHQMEVEAGIHQWFQRHYDAAIYPDFFLEKRPELFDSARVVVLAYHMEYVSGAMYDMLEHLAERGTSLISLGGNQIYWKIRWHDDYTRVEARKDLTFFVGTWSPGGMWRHNLRFEDRLLGVRYDRRGLHTFAPYQVTEPGHWLFSGTGVEAGQLFGFESLDGRPISGMETDKMTWRTRGRVERIARGLNRREAGRAVFDPDDASWNGEGGADFVIRYPGPHNAVLSTGSIHSGAGLGADSVFTAVIRNFMARYAGGGM